MTGSYALCVDICFFKRPDSLQEYGQEGHLKGFSPVCVIKCFFKSPQVVEE